MNRSSRALSTSSSSYVASPQSETREAILDAAEELLAKQGVAGTSIRDIVKLAGVNLGAINYHFGSKDHLVLEVFHRRMRPLDEERLARLDALEKAAGRKKLKVEEILDALIRPMVESPHLGARQQTVIRLICSAFYELSPQVQELANKEMIGTVRRFDAAFIQAGVAKEDLYWKIMFFVGAFHFGLEAWQRFGQGVRPDPDLPTPELNREQFIQHAIAFIAAGMRARVPGNADAVTRKGVL